jgi:hypothetical protein
MVAIRRKSRGCCGTGKGRVVIPDIIWSRAFTAMTASLGGLLVQWFLPKIGSLA